ncbi:hypothetical protein [Streptomyces sp. NPDC088847]|uniref:hypothetical protein n=1 Tax=Streptomyces sp. NPDC088847 TaxID=3365909 RepID=UPI003811F9C8
MPTPTTTTKVMAIVIALESGLIAAFIAFMACRHYDAGTLAALGSVGGGFLAISGLVRGIAKEIGLL